MAAARRSNARPQHVPGNKHAREIQRPQDSFYSRTGRKGHDELHVLLPPVGSADVQDAVRNWHSRLKKAKTPDDLLQILNLALGRAELDGSVIRASLQKCGHGRWWHALLEVDRVQLEASVELRVVERSIFLNALASCLKDASLSESTRRIRKDEALQKGMRIWQGMPESTSEVEFNCALGSAWNLCASAGGDTACEWAIELHEWSCSQPFKKNIVTYTSFLTLLESCGCQERVNDLLQQIVQEDKLSLNEVVLGSLVNAAGSAFDWQRVDRLWGMLTTTGVRPNVICYTALAKAHMLSGRPEAAAESLDAMRAAGVGANDAQAALCYLQALVICCHSAPTPSNFARLKQCLKWGDSTMSGGSRQIQQDWERLAAVAERLVHDPASLQFHELLVQLNAKRNGKMKDWPNHEAGSGYLQRFVEKSRPTPALCTELGNLPSSHALILQMLHP